MNLSSLRAGPPSAREIARDAGLLLLRAGIGGTMMLAHGLPKLTAYTDKSQTFPDPLGLGTNLTLALAVFVEVFCSLALVIGLTTRAASAALALTMLIAFFVVHGDDPFAKKELALMYALPCLALIITGAGRFSLDQLLFSGRSRGSLRLDV